MAYKPSAVERGEEQSKEECAQVTVAEERSRRQVLRKGSEKGEIGTTPAGGQTPPMEGSGDREKCRYAQKKETKKKTSEHKKKIQPRTSEDCTRRVWYPRKVPSTTTFRSHPQRTEIRRVNEARGKKNGAPERKDKAESTVSRREAEAARGQGESVTK